MKNHVVRGPNTGPKPFGPGGPQPGPPMVNRVYYNIAYHWMIPSPKGGYRSGFADIIMWFPSPLNHPAKLKALKVSLSHMMETTHQDERGAAILGLPDDFKYPKVSLITWTKIMEDRVPESQAKSLPVIPPEMAAEFEEVPDSTDPIAAMTKGNAPKLVLPLDPAPIPDRAPEESSGGVAPDAGTNSAPPPEGQEPGSTSGDQPALEEEAESSNLRPFRGKVMFPSEGEKKEGE